MIRQPEREQISRLMAKALDQVFIARAQEGLGCSLFEARAHGLDQRGLFPLADST